jgi:hypothetical protein
MTISKSMTYAIIPISVIALATGFTIIPSTFDVYAITGGDSGVGLKPTLGVDNRGYTLIEDGLTINGQTFKAEYFSQTIQTQTIKVNQPIDITLHLFLIGGLNNLAHTALSIDNGEESKHIEWNQDFKGTQTVSVSDNEFFKNVMVKSRADPNNPSAAFLNFKFQISEKTETSKLKIVTWNSAREGWTNYFYDAIKVGETILDTSSQTSDMNEIKSPLKQTRDGVSASDVKCDLGKKLMFKNNGTPICVSPASASKLVAMGWAKQA